MTAVHDVYGYRQIKKQSKALNVAPIAEAIAVLIIARKDDPCLKWNSAHDKVVVQIGKVIPEEVPATTSARRKRFRAALELRLTPAGWKSVRANVYRAPRL